MIEKLLLWLLRNWQNRESLKTFGAKRDSRWPFFRRQIIFERGYKCEATGRTKNIDLHHIKPFHRNPELELDPKNVILLNEDVHLILGHLLSWKSWNKNIVEDAKKLLNKIENRP